MDIREFVNKQFWRFASTYAKKAPHEYIIRHKSEGTDEEFLSLAHCIEKYGMVMWFWNRPNKYLYLDGKYYWTMSTQMDSSGKIVFNYNDPAMVINRSNADDYKVSIMWKGAIKKKDVGDI